MRTLSLPLTSVALLAAAAAYLPDDKLVEGIEQQVRKLQPTRAEKRFDEIGWASSILAAEKAAAAANRPAFIFFYNGSIDTGRC